MVVVLTISHAAVKAARGISVVFLKVWLDWWPLASLASNLKHTATGGGVSQPVGTCAGQSAEGSHTGWY